ncbi:MAG: FAD-dependent oxidoreductase [Thermoleophilia bacterium]
MSAPAAARRHLDLLVVGAGPAGRRAAITAAHLGARTAIADRGPGPTGLLPFRALHAAAGDAIAARRARPLRGGERPPDLADLLWRADRLVEGQRDAVRDQLRRERVEVLEGAARLTGPHEVDIDGPRGTARLTADRIVIATGGVPRRPPGCDRDGRLVMAPEDLPSLPRLPGRLTVVGAGVTGLEVAAVATALGASVTLVDRAGEAAPELDHDIVAALLYHLRGVGMTVRLGREVRGIDRREAGGVVAALDDGGEIAADALVFAGGRDGATAGLGLDAAGLAAGPHGHIPADARGRTAVPHLFAAGEVTGAAGRTAAAMDAGRRAALTALGRLAPPPRSPLPLAVATVPEIAAVGPTDRELALAGAAPVPGVARFADLIRGELSGERAGMLKLLADPGTGRVLAVHILGAAAGELVHVGQAAIAGGMTVHDLADAVAGPATFAEAYAVAAADAACRMRLGDDRRCEAGAVAPRLGA